MAVNFYQDEINRLTNNVLLYKELPFNTPKHIFIYNNVCLILSRHIYYFF